MQLASIEFARNVCGIKDATSREFENKKARNYVIDFMEEQKGISNKGGTMRLGAYPCTLKAGSKAAKIYNTKNISERHRHRYEFNNKYRPLFEKKGMELTGVCKERDLVEIIEIKEHPWFLAVQFHPEFKSKPTDPHPLFKSFVKAAVVYSLKNKKRAKAKKTIVKKSKKKTTKKAIKGSGRRRVN